MSLPSDGINRFLIIDDHPLFREALHSAVELAYPNSDTLDAASLSDACTLLEDDSSFDLALLDLSMPGVTGMDGLLHLRTHYPRLPVVVVSGAEDPPVIAQAMAYGAAGFIPKSSKKTTLAEAIQHVMNGDLYVPEAYEADGDPIDEPTRKMIERLSSLTPQQIRVLQMICNGLLNKQIAYELSVGETTVKAHVSEILRKLAVSSRTQAVIEVKRLEALGTADPFDFAATGERALSLSHHHR